ncbi:helix-turn-helix domain-containing protein [Kribbella sp. NPDC056345]|uniref:helix-turn-helix domain-containing protein n=1 Tax=Kribbella sp. NPDC056345 TaxID=3345789 RepID=UPI0035DA0B74
MALQLLDEHRALGLRPLAVHHALRQPPGVATAAPRPLRRSLAHPGTAGHPRPFPRRVGAAFRELHRAKDYALLLGCSVRTLSRAVQDATGKAVREVINERRLLEARRLLGDAQWTPQATAAHLGFTDTANFGRFFRQYAGLTPGAYAARNTIPYEPSYDRPIPPIIVATCCPVRSPLPSGARSITPTPSMPGIRG